ncbi:TspO/MBR family protein [Lentzea flava]|uniref:TspO/MBR-related protein n=1 Tax=Lentzea flava TaxID=103732 RepID=A0ABQ2UIT2_9PSEU|nr:TspO/MBR family protein [Lentzea flava]MCP2199760.1 TspO and MBR related proteins [Lentzea flava]GGU38498.1 putative TspO/MBR-related protein precursor [Lentzea flava]
MTALPLRHHPVRVLLVFLAAVVVTAVAGSLFSVSAGAEYLALRRPSWAPPSWLFGPVWTVLYGLIAVSGWLAWRHGARRGELTLFGVQLVLNAAWTPLFFGLRWYGIAFAEIVVLWLAIVALVVVFWWRSRAAALLLVPYLAWVSFAAALNVSIATLN